MVRGKFFIWVRNENDFQLQAPELLAAGAVVSVGRVSLYPMKRGRQLLDRHAYGLHHVHGMQPHTPDPPRCRVGTSGR
jgi:hypothetical protein